MQSTLNHNCGLQSVVSMSQQRPEGKPAGEDLFTGTCKVPGTGGGRMSFPYMYWMYITGLLVTQLVDVAFCLL